MRGGGEDCVGRKLGLDGVAGAEYAQPGSGCGLHGIADRGSRIFKKLFGAEARLGDDVDRAVFKRFECALRAFVSETGANDNGDGVLAHDLFEEGEAIHARHFDVERDDVGDLFCDAVGGDKGIAGGGDDFDFRVGVEYLAQSLAHNCGVVHY